MVNKKWTLNLIEILSTEQFTTYRKGKTVVNFTADWHEPCKDLNIVFQELSRNYPKLNFVQVSAEDHEDISEKFEIDTVPTFLILVNGEVCDLTYLTI